MPAGLGITAGLPSWAGIRRRSARARLLATGLIPLSEMAALLRVSTATVKAWYHAGIVSGQRYNDKGEVLYDPPDPGNPPDRPKTGRPPRTARPAPTQ